MKGRSIDLRSKGGLFGSAWLLASCLTAVPAENPSKTAKTEPDAPSPTAAGGATSAPAPARFCGWPGGAKAAVSLTYDDSLASQLTYAVPVLNHYGIKATFFLSGQNLASFAALTKQGHELASHTVRHPCGVDVARLTLEEMATELDAGIEAVEALGVGGKLSFAYPCGQMKVKNDESYEPLVQARFKAARAVAGIVAQPERVDLWRVPSLFPPSTSDGSDAIALIESAQQSQGWAVIGMHGVSEAGEYLQLSQAAHDKIVSYLADHRSTVWTAPFGEVADAIAACRAAH